MVVHAVQKRWIRLQNQIVNERLRQRGAYLTSQLAGNVRGFPTCVNSSFIAPSQRFPRQILSQRLQSNGIAAPPPCSSDLLKSAWMEVISVLYIIYADDFVLLLRGKLRLSVKKSDEFRECFGLSVLLCTEVVDDPFELSGDLGVFNLESSIGLVGGGFSSLARRVRPSATSFGADRSISLVFTSRLIGPGCQWVISDGRRFAMSHLLDELAM